MKIHYVLLCLCFSCLVSLALAQDQVVMEEARSAEMRPYASLALGSLLILPGIEARFGVKGVGAPELELRGDLAAYIPGLYKVAANVLYNVELDGGSELYAGAGGRLYFDNLYTDGMSAVVGGVGIITGLETALGSNAASYFEFGGDVLIEATDFGFPIIVDFGCGPPE